jgi:hypothetical protein
MNQVGAQTLLPGSRAGPGHEGAAGSPRRDEAEAASSGSGFPRQSRSMRRPAPYNAVWRAAPTKSDPSQGELAGFIDWDLAGPAKPVRDLASVHCRGSR